MGLNTGGELFKQLREVREGHLHLFPGFKHRQRWTKVALVHLCLPVSDERRKHTDNHGGYHQGRWIGGVPAMVQPLQDGPVEKSNVVPFPNKPCCYISIPTWLNVFKRHVVLIMVNFDTCGTEAILLLYLRLVFPVWPDRTVKWCYSTVKACEPKNWAAVMISIKNLYSDCIHVLLYWSIKYSCRQPWQPYTWCIYHFIRSPEQLKSDTLHGALCEVLRE